MPEENKPAQQQPEMVPISALLKAKDDKKTIEAKLKEAENALAALRNEQALLDQDLKDAESATDPEKIKLAKKKLLERHREIDRRESELKTKEGKLAESERKIQAAELAGRYGVPADALLAAEGDMEKEALRLNHELRGSQGGNFYERGGGAPVGKKSVAQMSDAEFAKHWEEQVKGAYASKA